MLVFWSSGYKALTSEVYARHIRSNAFDLRRNLSNTFMAKANVLQATGKLGEPSRSMTGIRANVRLEQQDWTGFSL